MTSKEFIKEHIEQLEEAYGSVSKLDLLEVKEDIELELDYFKNVLNDLELLEILKKYLEIKGYNDDYLYPVIKLCISSVGTEKDFNLIKEWLEQ